MSAAKNSTSGGAGTADRHRGVAICLFVADPAHRLPRRPRWRWIYRQARRHLLKATTQRGRVEPREVDFKEGLANALAGLRMRCGDLPPVLLLTPDDIERPEGVDEVVRFDPTPYLGVRGVAYEFGVTIFYKLEIYRSRGFERLVYLDTDLLIVDDISELWDLDRYRSHSMYAVRESPATGATHEAAFGSFNAGVLLLNSPMMDGKVHDELLRMARAGLSRDGGDQGLLNRLLDEAGQSWTAGELDPSFNMFTDDASLASGLVRPDVKILHFTGDQKPFGHRGARPTQRPTDRLYDALVASRDLRPLASGVDALLERQAGPADSVDGADRAGIDA